MPASTRPSLISRIRVVLSPLRHRTGGVRTRVLCYSTAIRVRDRLDECILPPCATSDHLDAKVPEGGAVFEGSAAVPQARLPVTEGLCSWVQMPNRPASPPEIAEGLEPGKSALTRFDRFSQPAGDHVDLG